LSKRRFGAEEAYVALWKIAYMILRGVLRVLIGRRRRQSVQHRLGLHFQRAENIKYGSLSFEHEPQVRKILRSKLKKGSTFLDVGSGIGVHAFYADRLVGKTGRVIILEPDPTNFHILKGSTWECENVTILSDAVWIEDGQAQFSQGNVGYTRNQDQSYSYTGSLTPLPEQVSSGFISDTKTKVSTVRLDTLLKRLGADSVDLAKFDIEGTEYEIFADVDLDLSKLQNLIIEAHGKYPSERAENLMRNIQIKGFRVFPLTLKETRDVHIFAEKQ